MDIEFESIESIREYQEDLLRKQMAYLAAHSPYYRRLFEQQHIDPASIRTIADLQRLPFTEKADLQRFNNDFLCVPREQIIDYITTSGTLGEPVLFGCTESDLQRLAYNEHKSFACAGLHKGDILCSDTIRSWYPTPLYQLYILDTPNENNMGANQFQGASGKGANGDMYLFRLAETYLLRAEARLYQKNATGAAEDVNAVRRRANAKKMYTTVNIGDIMAERARELYLEEFRQAEMVRVSWCLARSGVADEWGNTYDLSNWDKQEGTDLNGGSYWFRRCTTYNVFNHDYGKGQQGNQTFEYKINKHNLFWPVPNSAITANNKGQLRQNYGYDGYSESIPMWTNWEDAVADEEKAN